MEHGPVDVVILAFGEPRFDGTLLGELQRLAGEGTIRVLDAMVVMKDEDGSVAALDLEDQPAAVKEALGFIETGTRGMFDSGDADLLKEGIVPGSAVVALAVEHTWALGLRKALADVGGEVALTFRIPAPVVDDAFAELGVE